MGWLESVWLKILELRGEILAGIFAACIFILLFANGDYQYARDLSKEALVWIFLLAVLTFFLILARMGKAIFDLVGAWRKKRIEHSKAIEFQIGVLKYLDTLSQGERAVLSYLVQKNQQSFNGDMTARNVVTLQQKNLIAIGSGMMVQDDAPYIIPPFVWNELQARKAEFNTADLEGMHPWRDHWMTR
ncbi:MAG: super-infection exclusion protein B [Aestuariivirga sp.]